MTGFREVFLDEDSNERKWNLEVAISSKNRRTYFKVINFSADTHQWALIRTMDMLKRSAAKVLPDRFFLVRLVPNDRKEKENCILSEEQYWLKPRYRKPKQILRMKNPTKYFFSGDDRKAKQFLEKIMSLEIRNYISKIKALKNKT